MPDFATLTNDEIYEHIRSLQAVEDKTDLHRAALRAARGELTQRALRAAGLEDVIDKRFTETYSGTYTRRDGTSYDWEYRGSEARDGLFVALDAIDVRDSDEPEGYRGRIELHVRQVADGQWGAGSATIYGPEVRYDERIRDAYVTMSSSTSDSDTRGITALDGSITMLLLAREIAVTWSEALRPQLERQVEELRERKAEHAREREEQRERHERRAEAVDAYVSRSVRVTLPGRTTRPSGILTRTVNGLEVVAGSGFRVPVKSEYIERLEVKGLGGRYAEVALPPVA